MKKVKSLLLSLSMVGLIAGSVFANVYTYNIPVPTTGLVIPVAGFSGDTAIGQLVSWEKVTGMGLFLYGQQSNVPSKLTLSVYADDVLLGTGLLLAEASQGNGSKVKYEYETDYLFSSNLISALNGLAHQSGNIFLTLSSDVAGFSLTNYDGNVSRFQVTTAVPEPGTMSLLGMGLLGMIGFVRRKFVA
jgi:hypothetical protein